MYLLNKEQTKIELNMRSRKWIHYRREAKGNSRQPLCSRPRAKLVQTAAGEKCPEGRSPRKTQGINRSFNRFDHVEILYEIAMEARENNQK